MRICLQFDGFATLAEKLKGLKLNKSTTTSTQCGPQQGASSLRDIISDVMNMKKADWKEILEDLIGPQKLCSNDTTVTTDDPMRVNSEGNVSDGSSQHDFYLI